MEPGAPHRSTPPPGARPLYPPPGSRRAPPPSAGGRPRRGLGLTAAGLGLAVAGLLVFAMGGGGPAGSALSPVADAAKRTRDLAGVRFSGVGAGSSPAGEVTMTLSGGFDARNDRSIVRAEPRSPGAPDVAPTAGAIVSVQDGSRIYTSSPAFAAALPEGKSWLVVDASELGAVGEMGAGLETIDADAVLGQLELVSSGVRRVGRERIGRVGTIHYAATIDPRLEAEWLRDNDADRIADLVEEQGQPSRVDVWIDRRGLVRRTATTVVCELVSGSGARMSVTIDFHHFGEAPEIEVPATDAAYDVTELGREALEDALAET